MSRCGCRGNRPDAESNVRYLVEHILYEMLENGEIKPDLRDCNGACIGDKYVVTCEYLDSEAFIKRLRKKLNIPTAEDIEAIVRKVLVDRTVDVDIEDTFGNDILDDNLVASGNSVG